MDNVVIFMGCLIIFMLVLGLMGLAVAGYIKAKESIYHRRIMKGVMLRHDRPLK